MRILVLFLSIILLAACSDTQSTPDQAIVLPSVTAPLPDQKATESTTATPTLQITLVAKYTPTPRLITPAPSEGTFIDQSVVSQDGNWTALPAFETLSTGYRVSLKIFNTDKSVVWTPVDYTGDGLGYSFPHPKQWSSDSRYFYFLEKTTADGCGDFYTVEDQWQRLDVETGAVDTIDLPVGRGHMFSPDESFLAYTTSAVNAELVVQDLVDTSQEIVTLPITAEEDKIPQAGGIRWSPDGESLILAAASGNICGPTRVEFYLFTVQISDLIVETIYKGKDFIRPLEWSAAGKVRVMDWNSKSWWMNPTTGEITTAPGN